MKCTFADCTAAAAAEPAVVDPRLPPKSMKVERFCNRHRSLAVGILGYVEVDG